MDVTHAPGGPPFSRNEIVTCELGLPEVLSTAQTSYGPEPNRELSIVVLKVPVADIAIGTVSNSLPSGRFRCDVAVEFLVKPLPV